MAANSISGVVRLVTDVERKFENLVSARAVLDKTRNNEEDIFVTLNFYDKVAEVLEKYGKKGMPLFITGALGMRLYEGKQYLSVHVRDFGFVGGNDKASGGESNSTPVADKKPAKKTTSKVDAEENVPF